jgi:hypothetical protein
LVGGIYFFAFVDYFLLPPDGYTYCVIFTRLSNNISKGFFNAWLDEAALCFFSKAVGTALCPLCDLIALGLLVDPPPHPPPVEARSDTSAVLDWWLPGSPWIKWPSLVWKLSVGESAFELALWQLLQVQVQVSYFSMILLEAEEGKRLSLLILEIVW